MPALFVFLLKVNIALLLFCAGYYLVLRHLTFYTLNRIYLVGSIIFATVYPKINLSGFLERHREIAKPVEVVAFNWQAPAKAFVKPFEKPDYWMWAEIVLWTGVVLLALRLLGQLYSLYKLYRSSTAAQIHEHEVRVINSDSGPFSFWNSIFINPARHEPADLRSILSHEQVHVSEWHTLDILLAELSTIFYWFNPGVWLMKKAVRENIEFITDRKILKNGTDSKQYQYSLVNVSFSAAPQGIVNHFNISTIKKRIIMMNAKRSSKFTLTRYAFLVPAVILMLLVFSISKAALVKNNITGKAFANTANRSAEKRRAVVVVSVAASNSPAMKAKAVPQKITAVIDTIKKGKFFLSTSDNSDSLNYVINGVKAKKADLLKLDESRINNVNFMTPEAAAKIMDHLDSKHGTLFITTDDSEAGKKFKEKLDKETNRFYVARGGDVSSSANGPTKLVVVSGIANGSAISYTDDDAGSTGKGRITKVESFNLVTKTGSVPATLTLHSSRGNGKTTTGTASYSYSTNDSLYKSANGAVVYRITADSNAKRNSGSGPYTILNKNFQPLTFASNSRFSLDHISNKLIIINGKIASVEDLKKISAFDIDRMVLKTDEETKELYGDKAKNGIVFIVTKKK